MPSPTAQQSEFQLAVLRLISGGLAIGFALAGIWGDIKELAEMGKTAADIARELKTSPYLIQKTLPLVSRFSFPRLRRALILLADFDQALKTGRLQPGVALDLFVWKF